MGGAALKLLLDTHVWIWSLVEPERLSRGLRQALRDSSTQMHLSPISVWETLVLARKGRLELDPDPHGWIEKAVAASATRMAPITHAIAAASEALPDFPSRDPADRFLAATARVEGLTLATLDRALRAYPEIETIA